MDKISIQITINAITSPELLQYLASIQSPKHRSERLRQLAEIGLGTTGTTASGPIAASRQPIVQVAPVVPPSPVSEASQPTSRPEPPVRRPAAPAVTQAASPAPSASGALPEATATEAQADAASPLFALHLNSAMDRFF